MMRSLFLLILFGFTAGSILAQSLMKDVDTDANRSASMPFSTNNFTSESGVKYNKTNSVVPVALTGSQYESTKLYNHDVMWNTSRWEFTSQSGTATATRNVEATNTIAVNGDGLYINNSSSSFFFTDRKYPACEGWDGNAKVKMTGMCRQVMKVNTTGDLYIYNETVLVEKRNSTGTFSSTAYKINAKSRYVGLVGSDSLQAYHDGTKWIWAKKPSSSGDAWNLRVTATWITLATSTGSTLLPPKDGWTPAAEFSNATMTTGGTQATLPVTLVNFDAKALENRTIKISWETSEEINAAYFVVEKSRDLKRFSEVARLETGSNSVVNKRYSVVDQAPFFGTSYYRLRQVDFDGKFQVFRIVSVLVADKDQPFGAYPNPAGSEHFSLKVENAKEATVEFYDVMGRLVSINSSLESDHMLLIRPKARLVPGMYIARVKNLVGTSTHKVVIR